MSSESLVAPSAEVSWEGSHQRIWVFGFQSNMLGEEQAGALGRQ